MSEAKLPSPPPPTPQPSPAPKDSPNTRFALVVAGVIVAVGLWLLLESMGVLVPSLARIWPTFIAIGGLVSLIDYFAFSRRGESLGRAVLGLGLAASFYPFSLGYIGWGDVLDWLPSLPLILGLSLLATWGAKGLKSTSLLVLGAGFGLLGLLGFAARFEALRELLPSVQVIWAITLLVAGGVLAWRVIQNRT